MEPNDNRVFELRQSEIVRLDEDIRSYTSGIDKFVSMAGLVGAAIVTIGIVKSGGNPYVAIFAPYGLAVLLTYLLQLFTDIEYRFALRQVVEERLNHAFPAAELLQPLVIDVRYRNRLSVRGAAVSYAVYFVAATAASFVQAHQHLRPFLQVANYVGLALAAALMATAFFELYRAGDRARIAANSEACA